MEDKKIIYIAGLGASSFDSMSLKVYRLLSKNKYPLYLRTGRCEAADELNNLGIKFKTLDEFYEKSDEFEETYENISEFLISECEKYDRIIFAVPGNPALSETVTALLIKKCPGRAIQPQIFASIGYLEQIASLISEKYGIDIGNGSEILDATNLNQRDINPRLNLLIAQVYDRATASEVKFRLGQKYPDDTKVVIIDAAGTPHEKIDETRLYEMDHREHKYGLLTSLFVKSGQPKLFYDMDDLIEQVKLLRSDDGCPLDKKQTFESIKQFFIEESKELVQAVDNEDIENFIEEMGDVLFQLIFFAELAEKDYGVNFYEITDGIYKKMLRRHPHVYKGFKPGDEELAKMWEDIKRAEHDEKNKKSKK